MSGWVRITDTENPERSVDDDVRTGSENKTHATHALGVPGGTLYRSTVRDVMSGRALSVALVFVPRPPFPGAST